MRQVNLGKLQTNANGVVQYPVDINEISNTFVVDGDTIADYSGDKNFPLYAPQPPKVDRVLTPIEFEGRFPLRAQLLLADPSLSQDPAVSSICSLLSRRIALSQARNSNGDRGVDLDNPMTRQGVQEAVKLMVITQEEADAVFAAV